MKRWVLFLGLLTAAGPAYSKIDLGSSAQNVDQQMSDMQKFLDSLAHEKPVLDVRRAAATMRESGPGRPKKGFWNEALEDPYKKRAAMDYAKGLAGSGLASVGSGMAGQMETLLGQEAAAMIASGDPTLLGMGRNLQQESAAISSNNSDAAQSAADAVKGVPDPNVANYSPTASDLNYSSDASQATAKVAAAVLTAVGTIAGAVVGFYSTLGGGTGVGAMYGAALGSMAGNAVGSAIDGSQNDTAGQAAGIGVQAIQSASQAGVQKVQSSAPPLAQAGGSGSQSAATGAPLQSAPTGNGSIVAQPSTANNVGAAGGAGQ